MATLDRIAEVLLLPESHAEPPIQPRIIIVHTMVGSLRGVDSFFRNSSAVESHFGVGGSSDRDLDGTVFQWQDTTRTADANNLANEFAISIETSDGGDPSRPWSPKQIDAILKLIKRLSSLHEIPIRLVGSWNDKRGGLGWHAMWGAPSPWTPVAGKTCPGPIRIHQFKNVILPRLGISKAGGKLDRCKISLTAEASLRKGDEGKEVRCWQHKWNMWLVKVERRHHVSPPEPLEEDGDFGPKTAKATRYFQKRWRLPVTGRVDQGTLDAMEGAQLLEGKVIGS